MISFPNCKINIGLSILQKRSDGFHDIETVFCPVHLSDILEFVPGTGNNSGINLTVTGLAVDCDPQKNLCTKAYELLRSEYELPPLDVYLHKVIPSGAGLGGGSSDAAFMLSMLSQAFIPGLDEEKLCKYASSLGSDCAFFIRNRPLLGYGRGNLFREIGNFPDDFQVAIVHPRLHISTPEAYAGISPRIPENRIEDVIKLSPDQWKGLLINDFEESIFRKYPLIRDIKEKLYNSGAVYASMSGSGSAVYALFRNNIPDLSGLFPEMFCWSGTLSKMVSG